MKAIYHAATVLPQSHHLMDTTPGGSQRLSGPRRPTCRWFIASGARPRSLYRLLWRKTRVLAGPSASAGLESADSRLASVQASPYRPSATSHCSHRPRSKKVRVSSQLRLSFAKSFANAQRTVVGGPRWTGRRHADRPCHRTKMVVGTTLRHPSPPASAKPLTACRPWGLELQLSGGSACSS